MRSFIHKNARKCLVFNRGIGGNRSIMAQYLLEDDVFPFKPDYAVFMYGANDIGMWLYDNNKEETPELLQKRAERKKQFFDGVKKNVELCLQNGVIPILQSPWAMNELIEERSDIQTLGDNKEKEDYMGPSFYTRATFRKLNKALGEWSQELKEYAQKEHFLFFDAFEETRKLMLTVDGLYNADGVHYSKKGHSHLARMMLRFLGYETDSVEFERYQANDELAAVEDAERKVAFFKWGMFNPYVSSATEEEKLAEIKRLSEDETQEEWLIDFAKNYFIHKDNVPALREEILRRLTEFCM
jgi:lysophospholipase L1-like esterase